jgi:hypothetical protein
VAEVTDISLYTTCTRPVLQRVPKEEIVSLAQGTNTYAGGAHRYRKSYRIASHMLCIQICAPSVFGNIECMQVCGCPTEAMLDKGMVAHRTSTVNTGYSGCKVSILCH